MSTRRTLLVVLVTVALLVVVGVAPRSADIAHALSAARTSSAATLTILYAGRLANAVGQPVTDGVYDFTFALYDAESDGALLWAETQRGVKVTAGTFVAPLGSAIPIPAAALEGSKRWLAVGVRGPGEREFMALMPRQELGTGASAPQAAPAAGPSCPHDHVGDPTWTANIGWSNAALRINNSANGPAFWGDNTGGGNGVRGESTTGLGVYGWSESSPGVSGRSTYNRGVEGYGGIQWAGVYGEGATGVKGYSTAAGSIGVWGEATGTNAIGVQGTANTGGLAIGVYGVSSTGWAGKFDGAVLVNGALVKGGGGFKIDHPLDPANKYLYHSFVESPDMMNIYNGNVTTDANGDATVVLPDYFEVLNRDFRYQLTVIGQFAQAIVKDEIKNNRFTIKTDKPNVKVSWQVTGIRHDAFADQHRIPVEETKSPEERGLYLYPEEYGLPKTMGIGYAKQQQAR